MPDSPNLLYMIGFTCRSLAQCAKQAGFVPIVIDRCGDRDTRDSADRYYPWVVDRTHDSFFQTCHFPADNDSQTVDLCILAGGTENDPKLIESLSARFPNVMKPARFASMRSWENWKSWSESSGMFFPRTWQLTAGPSDESLAEAPTEILLKKLNQAGGLGVSCWARDFRKEQSQLEATSDDAILQERIVGDSVGVTFLSSAHGSVALGCTESWTASTHPWGPFVYHGSVGPVSLSASDWTRLDKLAQRATDDSKWQGLWQADFIRSDNRWYLLEINPRWTASMELLEASTGLQLVNLHCQASAGHMSHGAWRNLLHAVELKRAVTLRCFAKRVLYAPEPINLDQETIERWWGDRLPLRLLSDEVVPTPGCWIADIPDEPMRFDSGYPVCTLISIHQSPALAREILKTRLRFESQRLMPLVQLDL